MLIRLFFRFFSFFVISFIFIIAATYFLLNSKWFMERCLVKVINGYLHSGTKKGETPWEVESLKLRQERFRFPFDLDLTGITSLVKNGKDRFNISADQFNVTASLSLLGQKEISCRAQGFDLSGPLIKTSGAQFAVDIIPTKEVSWQGNILIRSLNANNYQLNDLSSVLRGQEDKITFDDLTASFYKGKIKGNIVLNSSGDLIYSIKMELKDIDLDRLKMDQPGLFSRMKGRVDGELVFEGNSKKLSSINAHLKMNSGGEMKASLLTYLLQYIPNSVQRKDLEALIKDDGDIPLDKAFMVIKSVSDQSLKGHVNLESRKFNLKIGVDTDVNVDGGLNNLLHYLK